jgi:hypothetical protein
MFLRQPIVWYWFAKFSIFWFWGRRAFYEPTISCLLPNIRLRGNNIVIFCHNSTHSLSSNKMVTPDHCTVCNKSFKRLLHHLNQSLACKSHYMASDKAATTVPSIVPNIGHVKTGNLLQGGTSRTFRPNLSSPLSDGLLPVLESGGIAGKADDELRVEDVNEVDDYIMFDDDGIPEQGDADDQDISDEGRAMPVPTSQQPATEDGCRERALSNKDNQHAILAWTIYLLKSQRELSDGDVVMLQQTTKTRVLHESTLSSDCAFWCHHSPKVLTSSKIDVL